MVRSFIPLIKREDGIYRVDDEYGNGAHDMTNKEMGKFSTEKITVEYESSLFGTTTKRVDGYEFPSLNGKWMEYN